MYGIDDAAFVAIITGLISLAKEAGLPAKWSPLLSLLLGVLVGVFYVSSNLSTGILSGVVLGLASVGLYSGPKNIIEKVTSK
jgi:hypothetical protein